MFVMAGAISVHFFAYKAVRNRPSPLFDTHWHVPNKRDLTPALMFGAFIFGVGWALAGFCPGPGITSLASFEIRPVIFVVSMLVGMFIFKMIDKKFKIAR